jgi:hypothetical protein
MFNRCGCLQYVSWPPSGKGQEKAPALRGPLLQLLTYFFFLAAFFLGAAFFLAVFFFVAMLFRI